jgi:hypothetical protein
MAQLFARMFVSTILGVICCCSAEPEVPRQLLQMAISQQQSVWNSPEEREKSEWIKAALEKLILDPGLAIDLAKSSPAEVSTIMGQTERTQSYAGQSHHGSALTDVFFSDASPDDKHSDAPQTPVYSTEVQTNPFIRSK